MNLDELRAEYNALQYKDRWDSRDRARIFELERLLEQGREIQQEIKERREEDGE